MFIAISEENNSNVHYLSFLHTASHSWKVYKVTNPSCAEPIDTSIPKILMTGSKPSCDDWGEGFEGLSGHAEW